MQRIYTYKIEQKGVSAKPNSGPEDVVQLEDLAAVRCPTLFICGEEDPLFPSELLASYVPHFSDARIEVVENSGHSDVCRRRLIRI